MTENCRRRGTHVGVLIYLFFKIYKLIWDFQRMNDLFHMPNESKHPIPLFLHYDSLGEWLSLNILMARPWCYYYLKINVSNMLSVWHVCLKMSWPGLISHSVFYSSLRKHIPFLLSTTSVDGRTSFNPVIYADRQKAWLSFGIDFHAYMVSAEQKASQRNMYLLQDEVIP